MAPESFRVAGLIADSQPFRSIRPNQGLWALYASGNYPDFSDPSTNYVTIAKWGGFKGQQWKFGLLPNSGQIETVTKLQLASHCLHAPQPLGDLGEYDFKTPPPDMQPCAPNTIDQTWDFLHHIEIFFEMGSVSTNDVEYWCLTVPESLGPEERYPVSLEPAAGRPYHQLWSYLPISKQITFMGLWFLTGDVDSGAVYLSQKQVREDSQRWTLTDNGTFIGPGERGLAAVPHGKVFLNETANGNQWFLVDTLDIWIAI